MVVAGIILLAIAIAPAVYIAIKRREIRARRASETFTARELHELSGGVSAEVGGGAFRQRCDVVGQAVPGPGGTLTAPESATEAVWHRSKVSHRYWEMQTTGSGNNRRTRRVEREETVSEQDSEQPFELDDGTGRVGVVPAGARFDRPQQTVDRFEPHMEQRGEAGSGLSGVLTAALRAGERSGTIGFRYQEWVVRPGTRLYVHGEVTDATGSPAFAKPEKGAYLISTRSEEELIREASRRATWASFASGVLAVAGVVLIVVGIVI